MFIVELFAGTRRAVMVDELSRREAAKRSAPQLTRAHAAFFSQPDWYTFNPPSSTFCLRHWHMWANQCGSGEDVYQRS